MTRRLATSMICVLMSLVILRPTVFPSPTIAAQGAETATPPATDPSITPVTPDEPPPTELPPTPTIVPPTATATLVITEPPLTLQKSASVSRISAGNSFSYVLLIGTSNTGARTIQMHTRLDKLLKITGASTSSGGCKTGNLIICAVTARRNQPATITLSVRVIDNAPVGQFIISQAVAQDDLYHTAASDQVAVEVVGDAPAPTRVSQADSLPQAPPAGAGAPATGANPPAESAPQAPEDEGITPDEGMPPAAQVVELPTEASPIPLAGASETGATGLLEPLGSPTGPEYDTSFSAPQPANEAIEEYSVQPAPPVIAPQAPTPIPDRVPNQAGPPPASIQAAPLPATTTIPPAIGVITALFGLGLAIRGVRRVRQAGTWLAAQGTGVTQLQLLLRAATSRQRATAALIAGMERRSRLMTKRLEAPAAPAGEISGGSSEEIP